MQLKTKSMLHKIFILVLISFVGVSNFDFASTLPANQNNKNGNVIPLKKEAVRVGDSDIFNVTLTINNKNKADKTDVLLVLDASPSMKNKTGTLKQSSKFLVNKLLTNDSGNIDVGIVSFSNNAKYESRLISDKKVLNKAIDSLIIGNGKRGDLGIEKAQQILLQSQAKNKYMIVFTDGEANSTSDQDPMSIALHKAWDASNTGINIFSVGINVKEEWQYIVDHIGNQGIFTSETNSLNDIFSEISNKVYKNKDIEAVEIKDPIGSMFSIPGINNSNYKNKIKVVDGNNNPITTAEVIWDNTKEAMTIKLAKVSPEMSPIKIKYQLILDGNAFIGKSYPTNGKTTIKYKDVLTNKNINANFNPIPKVGIYKTMISSSYILADENGNLLKADGSGTIVYTVKEATVNTDDKIVTEKEGKVFTINAPATLELNGIEYKLSNINQVKLKQGTKTIAQSPVTVDLAQVPSANLYFAYKENKSEIHFKSQNENMGTVTPANIKLNLKDPSPTATATAKPGYIFIDWVNGGKIASETNVFTPEKVNGKHVATTYTARFRPKTSTNASITIKFKSNDVNMGTVTPASITVKASDIAPTAIATAKTGYKFSHWIDEDGIFQCHCLHFTPKQVEGLNIAATYTAIFEKINIKDKPKDNVKPPVIDDVEAPDDNTQKPDEETSQSENTSSEEPTTTVTPSEPDSSEQATSEEPSSTWETTTVDNNDDDDHNSDDDDSDDDDDDADDNTDRAKPDKTPKQSGVSINMDKSTWTTPEEETTTISSYSEQAKSNWNNNDQSKVKEAIGNKKELKKVKVINPKALPLDKSTIYRVIDEEKNSIATIKVAEDGTFTIIEDSATPLATIKIDENGNVEIVEIIDLDIPLANGSPLPKTAENNMPLLALFGLIVAALGVFVIIKRN